MTSIHTLSLFRAPFAPHRFFELHPPSLFQAASILALPSSIHPRCSFELHPHLVVCFRATSTLHTLLSCTHPRRSFLLALLSCTHSHRLFKLHPHLCRSSELHPKPHCSNLDSRPCSSELHPHPHALPNGIHTLLTPLSYHPRLALPSYIHHITSRLYPPSYFQATPLAVLCSHHHTFTFLPRS